MRKHDSQFTDLFTFITATIAYKSTTEATQKQIIITTLNHTILLLLLLRLCVM